MAAVPVPRWRALALPKEGHQPEEFEDAFAAKGGRFAIADGASESSFAREWAELLVEGFVGCGASQVTADWLNPLRQRWAAKVDPLELDWFGEEKRLQGAFATFLGLILKRPRQGRDGRWKALAVGDSCLFQVRQDQLVGAFPVRRSADFGVRPALLGSRRPTGGEALAQVTSRVGTWRPGDRFLLMTDALAEWFLRRHEERRKPWRALARHLCGRGTGLEGFVKRLRDAKGIKNDDVTLLRIDLRA
jgi:Protein phosphatase 2C